MIESAIIRPFDGSLGDAEGLLAVERATFDECPYSPAQIRAMLAQGPQQAWLAVVEGQIVGFVVAFATAGLRGRCWEIDVLAVRSDWTRQGLATRLVRTACAHGKGTARRARAVVATDNPASIRAFTRSGFHVDPQPCELWIYRLEDRPPRPTVIPAGQSDDVAVQEASNLAKARAWLAAAQPLPEQVLAAFSTADPGDLTLLLAEQGGRPAGHAELVHVQTLLYRGVWIEALTASTPAARQGLIHGALNRAIAAGLDEIGTLVPRGRQPLVDTLRAEGFESLGDFHWLLARLPLPGLASPSPAERTQARVQGPPHV
jgi:ribosomal protein S18 acetylase RimI-like enzyme